jgi:hypothetical protein
MTAMFCSEASADDHVQKIDRLFRDEAQSDFVASAGWNKTDGACST